MLLAANLSVPAPAGVELVQAPTADDMHREALARADADVVIMAAAVADYRPSEARPDKRPKDASPWDLELLPTADVARELGERRRNGQVLVTFGADHADGGLERKRKMLATKRADLVVFNDIGREDIGFESDENEVVLVTSSGERAIGKAPKREIAAAVLDEVTNLLAKVDGRGG